MPMLSTTKMSYFYPPLTFPLNLSLTPSFHPTPSCVRSCGWLGVGLVWHPRHRGHCLPRLPAGGHGPAVRPDRHAPLPHRQNRYKQVQHTHSTLPPVNAPCQCTLSMHLNAPCHHNQARIIVIPPSPASPYLTIPLLMSPHIISIIDPQAPPPCGCCWSCRRASCSPSRAFPPTASLPPRHSSSPTPRHS